MKSTFTFFKHAKLFSPMDKTKVQADFVEFEPGWVLFYEELSRSGVLGTELIPEKRLVLGVHKEHCYDLRETLND